MARSLLWFRRDLRIHDLPALGAAHAAGEVVPVFVVDPALVAAAGAPRVAYLAAALAALNEQLGGLLVVRVGDPRQVVPALAAEVQATAVFVSRDFTPYGRRRDTAVKDALVTTGSTLRGVGSPYAVEPGTVKKNDGTPYAVFTPFSKAWAAVGEPAWRTAPSTPEVGEVRWVSAAGDPIERWGLRADGVGALGGVGDAGDVLVDFHLGDGSTTVPLRVRAEKSGIILRGA
jgi:deoxyribodipyrimidine photo-lyase